MDMLPSYSGLKCRVRTQLGCTAALIVSQICMNGRANTTKSGSVEKVSRKYGKIKKQKWSIG